MSGKPEQDAIDCCPRCGSPFHCGMNDAQPCACTGVTLDAATLARLRQQYSGCLCLRCLHALAAGAAP
ncbi:MAG: cysteine-rich CWC family protein [Burkholderiaceae bacterium]|nr:cysteine-rich CWC family protein [Burkholderiaceae bacterium]